MLKDAEWRAVEVPWDPSRHSRSWGLAHQIRPVMERHCGADTRGGLTFHGRHTLSHRDPGLKLSAFAKELLESTRVKCPVSPNRLLEMTKS